MQTLDLMKLDMANFHIQLIRPHLQQRSIEYEKKKFAEYLELQDGEFLPFVIYFFNLSFGRETR